LIEAIVLQDTKAYKASPEKLNKENYEGITEIRKMDSSTSIEYIQNLVEQAHEFGANKLAAEKLDIPKSHKMELMDIVIA
jgi:hypothetical protein